VSGTGHAHAQITPGVEQVLVDRVAAGAEPYGHDIESAAIRQLTRRQREVFVAIALNEVPIVSRSRDATAATATPPTRIYS
jgi:hypothetical protein